MLEKCFTQAIGHYYRLQSMEKRTIWFLIPLTPKTTSSIIIMPRKPFYSCVAIRSCSQNIVWTSNVSWYQDPRGYNGSAFGQHDIVIPLAVRVRSKTTSSEWHESRLLALLSHSSQFYELGRLSSIFKVITRRAEWSWSFVINRN